jgi:hypothetical protein
MSRIVETYGDLSCGGIDVVPSKKKGGEICIYEYSLLCN